MRVLQLLLSPRIGGAETLADQLSEQWTSQGIANDIAYVDPTGDPGRRSARWRQVRAAARTLRPDVVLAHSALPNVYARLAIGGSVPVVTVLHSASDDFEVAGLRWAERLLRRRTPFVVAVSASGQQRYLERFPAMTGRTAVVPNGVRPGLEPAPAPAARASRIGVLARVSAQKRPDVWARAAIAASAERTGLHFAWWGPVPPPEEFRVLVGAEVEAAAGPLFRGPTDDIPGHLRDLDVYFHTADREGLSIALLEAAVAGLPIVCSDDVARTLPTGVVVETFRAGDHGDATRALLLSVSEHATRAPAARASAEGLRQRFGMPECAERYATLLHRVAGSR